MMGKYAPFKDPILREYIDWMTERVPGGIRQAWLTRVAAGFLQDASAALARGDTGEYMRLIK